jgi:hypothetical protein
MSRREVHDPMDHPHRHADASSQTPMMGLEELFASHGPSGEPRESQPVDMEAAGRCSVATAYDRARSTPDETIARSARFGGLAVVEHGIPFGFIPAGSFVMGSDDREPDERPAHVVWVDGFG